MKAGAIPILLADNEKDSVVDESDLNVLFVQDVMPLKVNLYRFALSIVANATDAEDAVAQSLLIAYEKMGSLKERERFKPWIMTILARECYAICKRRKRFAAWDDSLTEGVFENENDELWQCIGRLPEHHRAVIVLYYYEDMSVQSIARTLGIAQGTVKSRLGRARKALRSMLEEES